MKVKAGLLLDLGNSETRVRLVSGKHVFQFNLSNRFSELPDGYKLATKFMKGNSTIFVSNGQYFANGAIVDREFGTTFMRPTSIEKKTGQLVTKLSLNLAFLKALQLVEKVYNVPLSTLEVTFDVGVLLPPLEHTSDEDKITSLIREIDSVQSYVPTEFEKDIKVDKIIVHPEAVAAFFGAYFKEENMKDMPENEGKDIYKGDIIVQDNSEGVVLTEVEENSHFSTGYTLILDIGAGTTDIAMFRDMDLVENSKDTALIGGNKVRSLVEQDIRQYFGFKPTIQSMDMVIKEGILEEGGDYHDVSQLVTKAKKQYSQEMQETIIQYLERLSISLPNVKGLLVVGGGSKPTVRNLDGSGEVVSPAMSEILSAYLTRVAPKLQVVTTEGKDLRHLNIEGLTYMYKYQD